MKMLFQNTGDRQDNVSLEQYITNSNGGQVGYTSGRHIRPRTADNINSWVNLTSGGFRMSVICDGAMVELSVVGLEVALFDDPPSLPGSPKE